MLQVAAHHLTAAKALKAVPNQYMVANYIPVEFCMTLWEIHQADPQLISTSRNVLDQLVFQWTDVASTSYGVQLIIALQRGLVDPYILHTLPLVFN